MALPRKERFSVWEACAYIKKLTGEEVTQSQLIDWGVSRHYKLYLLVHEDAWGEFWDDNKKILMTGKLVKFSPNLAQASRLSQSRGPEGFARINIDWACYCEREFCFVDAPETGCCGSSPSFDVEDIVLMGDELDQFVGNYFKENQESCAEDELTESQRDTLLKQIGCLALLLAEKHGTLRLKDKPNKKEIAEQANIALDDWEAENTHGVAKSTLRNNIRDGLDLLK